MNWEAVGAVGEILGAMFVFCSLVYLIREIRNNSRNTLSQNINTEADQIQKFADLQARPALMSAMKKIYVDDEAAPEFEDAALLEAYYLSGLSICQAQFRQAAIGLKSNWAPYERLTASFFGTEYVRNWWKGVGSSAFFEDDFVEEVNRIISKGYDGDFWTKYGKDESTDA
jgi:hypothetical protein